MSTVYPMSEKKMSKCITPEEFNALWENNGLKYKFSNFYDFCLSRGLQGFPRENYLNKIYRLLKTILVEGEIEEPLYRKDKPIPSWWSP